MSGSATGIFAVAMVVRAANVLPVGASYGLCMKMFEESLGVERLYVAGH
jgi:hypothetical protein